MGAKLPYQICEIGSICRMWRNTQNTHLPCSPISIHTFLAEGDCTHCRDSHCANISIHTFLTEGDGHRPWEQGIIPCISIHTFLTEGDLYTLLDKEIIPQFQSTPSLRKVTGAAKGYHDAGFISIHTFLTEGDHELDKNRNFRSYFNPHLPYGRWLMQSGQNVAWFTFQSTPSLRKVTF